MTYQHESLSNRVFTHLNQQTGEEAQEQYSRASLTLQDCLPTEDDLNMTTDNPVIQQVCEILRNNEKDYNNKTNPMMTLKEREDIYGSCVKGVAEIILDDAIERAQEVTDELQQEYAWGVYTPDESDRKLTYEEASRGY